MIAGPARQTAGGASPAPPPVTSDNLQRAAAWPLKCEGRDLFVGIGGAIAGMTGRRSGGTHGLQLLRGLAERSIKPDFGPRP